MSAEFVSPEQLNKSVDVVQEISRDDSFFVAVIQKAKTSDSIQVCQVGIGEWIDVPLKMIASAKIVGTASTGGNRYQVALIKLNEPTDPLAKVAYKLLSQLGTIQRGVGSKAGCKCQGNDNKGESINSTYSTARIARPTGLGGGLGKFGIGGNCHFEFRCYDCTRCIPWTDVCWSSTCCDLVAVDCTIEV